MKFELTRFSDRFEPVEAAVMVYYEQTKEQAYRGVAAAIVLPDGKYWIGVTLCSPDDQFIKAVGRAKAIGRAAQSMCKEEPLLLSDIGEEYKDRPTAALIVVMEDAIFSAKAERMTLVKDFEKRKARDL